jgi:hypothetical protein
MQSCGYMARARRAAVWVDRSVHARVRGEVNLKED